MTAIKMHWQLTQGADGRPHLNMQWESAQLVSVRGFARTQIHRSARQNRETHWSCPMFCITQEVEAQFVHDS